MIDLPTFISKSYQLSQVLMEDPNNGVNGYKVRSLYFDTPFDVDYFEKRRALKRGERFACVSMIRALILHSLK